MAAPSKRRCEVANIAPTAYPAPRSNSQYGIASQRGTKCTVAFPLADQTCEAAVRVSNGISQLFVARISRRTPECVFDCAADLRQHLHESLIPILGQTWDSLLFDSHGRIPWIRTAPCGAVVWRNTTAPRTNHEARK